MRPAHIVFWTLLTLGGVWLQNIVPGVDFLAPGLILAMQEEKWTVPVWLGGIWLFIQEGTGSMPFGAGILWYGALAGLYFFGHWLFEARNFLFMLILGACLGAMHFLFINVMALLQDWSIYMDRLGVEAVQQALIFPIEWGLLYLIHHHLPGDPHAA
ncbi:hypothetical protein [Solidesulfovibrio magneticus]|uniref:Rod shape-determining protein MreD n=1 Tax=Solidesulfovibrio magneticus (strain ATCC 700980 / DSM 13731 / RS-1) TaxID=573370 RepID=C4XI01_SOLM1|nr:hypothetical protein [Solidesulfovibrio magneticus]BAH73963.1 hypothetical protein DMR_04720 [Solidesulfovibrio magneticus RS-1]